MRGTSAYATAFTASACGLIIEIVAGRLISPSIGISLYTWTSIIGVVLAGISAGNYLGGAIADRVPRPQVLGVILLAGGISSLSIVPLYDLLSGAFPSGPVLPRIVLFTAGLFLVPSMILGMVTPVVIKLRLTDLARTGNVVGRIYAVSTTGSIFGTYITGFVLIQWIGTRSVLLMVALALVLMAVVFGRLWDVRGLALALGAVFVAVAGVSLVTGSLHSPCLRESSYFCIKIREKNIDGRDVRLLVLDKLVHSYVDVDDPTFLVYSYEQVFADLTTYVARNDPRPRALFIGGGGYTMPRFLESAYPGSSVEVIEIDPEVTDVAHDYLGLPRNTSIVTYNRDARMMVTKLQEGKYDLIVGDAFNHLSVPYHLTTLEFDERIKDLLNSGGIYTVNVVDRLHSGRFLRAVANTLQQTFPHVYVMRNDDNWSSDTRYTYVVAASSKPISLPALASANVAAGRGGPVTRIMPRDLYDDWLNSERTILLTDDYVPVDNLLAPLHLRDE